MSDSIKASASFQISDEYAFRMLAAHIVDELERRDLVIKTKDPDELIEIAEVRALLGKRGRSMAYATFQRNFIESGLLHVVDPRRTPNRSKRYILRGELERVLADQQRRDPIPVGTINH